jgi:hypothetical protein
MNFLPSIITLVISRSVRTVMIGVLFDYFNRKNNSKNIRLGVIFQAIAV